MTKPTFYITTPIYYPSDKLHIGHAYTTVIADAISRWKRLDGFDVRFLTGTDEHGQKIQRRAKQAGLEPQQFVDNVVAGIVELWKTLKITHDDFIRTTDPRHISRVQKIFEKIYEKGDIYKSEYEGWYCADCEAYYTDTQHKDLEGRCPDHDRPLEKLREESYFFKMSKYADRLLEHIENNPDFIQPESRRNEMVSFIKSGLEDLCVSRTTFSWGVPVTFDKSHVVYVWFDALANYITALDYPEGDLYKKYWPADVHVMAKEIVRFHAVIWPIILMALGEPLPKKVFGHGWLVLDSGKMSKTRGNVIDPVVLVERYGLDAVRYFLLREMSFGADGVYSEESLVNRVNADLANDLGNLLHRTLTVVERSAEGKVPAPGEMHPADDALKHAALGLKKETTEFIEKLDLPSALAAVWRVIGRANKYIDEQAPWALARKGETERLGTVLYTLIDTLRILGTILEPILVESAPLLWAQLGLGDSIPASAWEALERWGLTPVGTVVKKAQPLFPRIDPKTLEEPAAQSPKQQDTAAEGVLPEIDIEAFSKIDFRTARVLDAEPVKGTNKLLRIKLDLGFETREIVSGIRKDYSPESLIGRTIIIVANLKPAKIRGIVSKGMLLAAEDDGRIVLVGTDAEVAPGTRIS